MSIIIEMPKNKMKQYFNSILLKEDIHYHNRNWFYIFPKNKEILKYWKYRKEIVSDSFSQYSNEILCFDSEEQFKDNILSDLPTPKGMGFPVQMTGLFTRFNRSFQEELPVLLLLHEGLDQPV